MIDNQRFMFLARKMMYENDEERCMDVYKKNKSLSSLGEARRAKR